MRFKVGDMVRLAVWWEDDLPTQPGEIGVIEIVGTLSDKGNRFDYAIDFPSDIEDYDCVDDWRLQPINPPAEPVSLTRSDEVSV